LDSLTHIALGACIGEILASKKIGKKALVVGAIAQNIPDVDIVCSFWMTPAHDVLAHRGFTHSFLFAGLISVLLAWLAQRWWSRAANTSFKFWFTFFAIQVTVHVLLDAFNAYGTGWFIPFSPYRVSFNALYVVDLFYSVPMAILGFLLFVLHINNTSRMHLAYGGIVVSTLYLSYGVINKLQVNSDVKAILANQHIHYNQYFSTPTPLNNLLWFVVASNDDGNFVGYRSVFDNNDEMKLTFFPRQDSLLTKHADADEVNTLKQFSQGYYMAEKKGDTLIFNDLRFGQVTGGWKNPEVGFAFHYYLYPPELDNHLVVQRGRFENWDNATIHSFLDRIKGAQ